MSVEAGFRFSCQLGGPLFLWPQGLAAILCAHQRIGSRLAQAAEEGLPLLRGAGVSGYKCVHEAKNVGRHTGVLHWSAACKVGGALKILGYFPSAEEAAPCSP